MEITPIHDLLCDAICHRQLIRFEYHGGVRTVEPHVYGYNSRGEKVLSGFQQYGFSQSHAPHHWKQFRVGEMRSFEVLPKMFEGPRPGYRGDLHVHNVICAIREDGPPLPRSENIQQSFDAELEEIDAALSRRAERLKQRARSQKHQPFTRSSSKWKRVRTEFVENGEKEEAAPKSRPDDSNDQLNFNDQT